MNYENVLTAVKRMNKELNIAMRHITISTVGVVPRIRQLAQDNTQVLFANIFNVYFYIIIYTHFIGWTCSEFTSS
jgi:hypothetical protein